MQALGKSTKNRFADAMMNTNDEDEDDEENITVTPRNLKRKRETTPPGQHFSQDAPEGIDMAGHFLKTFESEEEERLLRD